MHTTPITINGADLLTHSRMQCARTCLKKHWLRYEKAIVRDRQAAPLRLGSAVHLALELRAAGKSLDEAVSEATAGYDEIPAWANTDEAVNDWLVERDVVAALIAGYYWRWQDEELEVVANEFQFRIPIVNPETGRATPTFELGGKVDKIVRLADGRLAVMEHKTTGDSIDSGSDYWQRLTIDGQISLYMLAARECGHDVRTVLYDVIRKPSISPRKVTKKDLAEIVATGTWFGQAVAAPVIQALQAGVIERESPAMFGARLLADMGGRPHFYFARQEIPRLEIDLEAFRQELWDQQRDIRERQLNGRWYRNAAACLNMGRCEYADLCFAGIDVNEHLPSGYTRATTLHPELQGDTDS